MKKKTREALLGFLEATRAKLEEYETGEQMERDDMSEEQLEGKAGERSEEILDAIREAVDDLQQLADVITD